MDKIENSEDIYELAYSENAWKDYLSNNEDNSHISKQELMYLKKFVDEKKYLNILQELEKGEGFPIPMLMLVNKKGTEKKRVVFTFEEQYTVLLKFFGYQLHKYDEYFSSGLYSFRKNKSARTAIKKLVKYPNIDNKYGIKLDIHDYFNSVNIEILLPRLKKILVNQEKLYRFIKDILTNPECFDMGKKIRIKKGIMAGCPLSPFLANLALDEMDKHFENTDILYARYSDDIIIFADTKTNVERAYDWICEYLNQQGLTLNDKKLRHFLPGDTWDFLGLSYNKGEIDISKVSLEKIKAKIRRKARALYRWKLKKGASTEQTIRAYIRHFNRKFYDNPEKSELTWARWYFPLINTTESLKIIDHYMQENIRFIATGKHTKSNYNLRYETIKECGYRPLINEYYKYEKSVN